MSTSLADCEINATFHAPAAMHDVVPQLVKRSAWQKIFGLTT
jgi:hypothetical protein